MKVSSLISLHFGIRRFVINHAVPCSRVRWSGGPVRAHKTVCSATGPGVRRAATSSVDRVTSGSCIRLRESPLNEDALVILMRSHWDAFVLGNTHHKWPRRPSPAGIRPRAGSTWRGPSPEIKKSTEGARLDEEIDGGEVLLLRGEPAARRRRDGEMSGSSRKGRPPPTAQPKGPTILPSRWR